MKEHPCPLPTAWIRSKTQHLQSRTQQLKMVYLHQFIIWQPSLIWEKKLLVKRYLKILAMPKLSKQNAHLQKIRTSTLATQGEKERTPASTLLSPPPPPPLVLPPAALSLPSTSTSSAPDPLSSTPISDTLSLRKQLFANKWLQGCLLVATPWV
ncbi:uncharacterized protein LOC143029910 isoform X2 [Oratosquilla oratoria]